MKRLLATVVLAAALVPWSSHAQEAGPALAPEVEALYQDAVRALSAGRLEDATAMLQRVVGSEPRHAGAWLDLAMTQCELGNAAEAERLFATLAQRFALSPGILETVARYRATGCGRPLQRRTGAWLLAATRGHDDNVNQGAADPRFTIGTGSAQTEYELDPAFLPKADSFSQLGASWVRPLGDAGWSAIVQAYGRWHDREHAQDTASVLGALEHTWKAGGWRLRGTAALGYVTLDRTLYQRQQQLQARITPPLKLAPEAEFAFYGNLNHVIYPTRPAYDGSTLELGGIAAWRGKHSLTQATLTGLHDESSAGRPGGNRSGAFGSLQWYGEVAPRLALEAGLTYQRWRSQETYSPGLIEVRRLQQTGTARVAAQWRLLPHTSLAAEWRITRNRENIALFQYNSRALQLSLRWDNF